MCQRSMCVQVGHAVSPVLINQPFDLAAIPEIPRSCQDVFFIYRYFQSWNASGAWEYAHTFLVHGEVNSYF